MAKSAVTDWDVTPTNNSDIAGINIAEGCPASGINDSIRTMMAQIAAWVIAATGPLMRVAANTIANATQILDGYGAARYIGYRGLPPTASKTTSYTIALTDRDMQIPTTAGITVPPNSSVAFAIGDLVIAYNSSGSSITITQGAGVTLRLEGSATTGNRTVGQHSMACLKKVGTDEWLCSGVAVS